MSNNLPASQLPKQGRKLVVTLDHDLGVEMPDSEYDGWRLVSFNSRHTKSEPIENYVSDYDGNKVIPSNIGLRRKLKVGLAFFLSYYEHGDGAWSLVGEGTQCRWDTSRLAGILIWTGKPRDIGAKTVEDRVKDARSFLTEYNDWMNGVTFIYSVETVDGEDLDSVGGYIGVDSVNEALAEVLKAGDVVKVEGECSWAFNAPKGVEVVSDFDDEGD